MQNKITIDDIAPYVDDEIADIFRAFPHPASTEGVSQEEALRRKRAPN